MSKSLEALKALDERDIQDRRRVRACRAGQIAVLAVGVAFFLSLSSSDGETAGSVTTTSTTTTAPPPEQTTTSTVPVSTTIESTTSLAPAPEIFQFTVGGFEYNCVVVESPYGVVPGDNIWDIVVGQNLPVDMPKRWLGTIALNQEKGTVGDDPNLIFPGDTIYQLVDCALSPSLPATD